LSSAVLRAPLAPRVHDRFMRCLFRRRLRTDRTAPVDDAGLGKLAVFAGVRDYPARVKCAILAWHTLRAAVGDRHDVVSTE
jgi:NifU-like protein involved in Fe-S cluster formation